MPKRQGAVHGGNPVKSKKPVTNNKRRLVKSRAEVKQEIEKTKGKSSLTSKIKGLFTKKTPSSLNPDRKPKEKPETPSAQTSKTTAVSRAQAEQVAPQIQHLNSV